MIELLKSVWRVLQLDLEQSVTAILWAWAKGKHKAGAVEDEEKKWAEAGVQGLKLEGGKLDSRETHSMFIQNVYPSKRPGHLRCEISGKLTVSLEDSDVTENTKVTASEKPWLNQSMAKPSVLWVGLSVNRLFEALTWAKWLIREVAFKT